MAAAPDLRALCRTLSSTAPDDLLSVCPILVKHVLRCEGSLSAVAAEQPRPAKDAAAGGSAANEVPMLVHRLKTHIGTLLNGRTPASRFAGMVLAKAVVDVGGWECLRTSEPWVRALLSILQKPDPVSSKELCVVTLTRIYTLLQEYPTLVREIATPTVPSFITACLQLLKPAAPGKPPKVTTAFIETALSAVSALVPLYPTTIRPFVGQIKTSIRAYLAPTLSDPATVPYSLRRCARRLAALLHHTAPKNSHPEEWLKFVDGLVKASHSTIDQVFRAVKESWEPESTYARHSVSSEGEPHGGGVEPDDLPAWTGLPAGSQRLGGLLKVICECLGTPTRSPVSLPIAALMDLASRLLLVTLPPTGVQERDLRDMFLNASISREEKDELWSALPDIHVATVQLLSVLVLRLGPNALPLAAEMLDQAVRLLESTAGRPPAPLRHAVFVLLRQLLFLCGPTLPKITVDSLGPAIHICCRDLLGASGFLPEDKDRSESQGAGMKNGTRSNGRGGGSALANADLFLPSVANKESSSSQARRPTVVLDADHRAAAEDLLEVLLSHLPQRHLKKAERALLDRTAILSRSKAAMVAGVLHPYIDRSGRPFANTMPFLVRQFPGDAGIEILQTNLRTKPQYFGDVFGGQARGGRGDSDEDDEEEEEEPQSIEDAKPSVATGLSYDISGGSNSEDPVAPAVVGGFARHFESSGMALNNSSASKTDIVASATVASAPFVPLTLKRKIDDQEEEINTPVKRLDKGKAILEPEPELQPEQEPEPEPVSAAESNLATTRHDGSDSDSDESVHLQMDVDDFDDDEEEEEE